MKTLEELKAIRDKMVGQVGIRSDESELTRVVVGMATCGIAAGARPVLTAMSDMVQEKGLNNVSVVQTGCIGLCQFEPIVEVYAPGKSKVTYVKVDERMAREIVEKHVINHEIIEKYTIK